jgi:electron transfer flavoprotein alpha subunit/NAD-dependent dihydropyrimidine dehydrogenase PreA subunit
MGIVISESDCKACWICIERCVFSAIEKTPGTAVINREKCVLCGVCLSACPYNAIQLDVPRDHNSLKEAYRGVWVFMERQDGGLSSVSYELLAKGRELADSLGQELVAVLFCDGKNAHLTEELRKYRIDRIIREEHDLLGSYDNQLYTHVLSSLILKRKPSVVLIPATDQGRELAPSAAARTQTGLTADCTDLGIDLDGRLLQVRPAYGGNVMATIITPEDRPQMATVRPGVFIRAEQSASDPVLEVLHEDFSKIERGIVGLQTRRESSDLGVLESARFVLAGGAGLGSRESFQKLIGLGRAMGAVIGASREAVDRGWISKTQQIGQTGSSISPELYVACGISGAIHHLVGIQRSRKIIAINRDSRAPIMRIADIAIVGDALSIIGRLAEHIIKEV